MSTLQEIKAAVSRLPAAEQALLAADLFVRQPSPDDVDLESALQRGLSDVDAGKVRPLEDVRKLIGEWTARS